MKNIIFSNLLNEYYASDLPQKYFSLHKKLPNKSKFRPKNFEKIYVIRDNLIKFTYFCIFTKNYFLGGNDPEFTLLCVLLNKVALAKSIRKIFSYWDMKNVTFSDLSKKYYGGERPPNYFSFQIILPNRSKFKSKNLEKIYFTRNN